jgi:hypothetical protein
MGLLAISTLGIFMNILDFDTYCLPGDHGWQKYTKEELLTLGDYNAMSIADRAACSLARGMSLSLHGWIQANFSISDANNKVLDMNGFITSYISNHLYGIWDYKMLMTPHPTLGAPNCTHVALCLISDFTFPQGSPIIDSYTRMAREYLAMHYPSPVVYGHHIHRLPTPIHKPWSLSVKTLMKMGTHNKLDMYFYEEGIFAGEEGAVSDRCLGEQLTDISCR